MLPDTHTQPITNSCNKQRKITRFGLLGLMAIDYKKPVKVISEDEKFMKQIEKWAVEE